MKYLKTFESFHFTDFTLSQLGNNDQNPKSNVSKDDLDQLKKKDINRLTELENKKPVKQMIKRFSKRKKKKPTRVSIVTEQ